MGGVEKLKLEEFAKPVIKHDEVLVEVYASGLNPVDAKIRAGLWLKRAHYIFPLILGWDVSGIVGETGKDIHNLKKGNAVYGRPDPSGNGTYAQHVAARAPELALKPQAVSKHVM